MQKIKKNCIVLFYLVNGYLFGNFNYLNDRKKVKKNFYKVKIFYKDQVVKIILFF